jgi:hypothetical protein
MPRRSLRSSTLSQSSSRSKGPIRGRSRGRSRSQSRSQSPSSSHSRGRSRSNSLCRSQSSSLSPSPSRSSSPRQASGLHCSRSRSRSTSPSPKEDMKSDRSIHTYIGTGITGTSRKRKRNSLVHCKGSHDEARLRRLLMAKTAVTNRAATGPEGEKIRMLKNAMRKRAATSAARLRLRRREAADAQSAVESAEGVLESTRAEAAALHSRLELWRRRLASPHTVTLHPSAMIALLVRVIGNRGATIESLSRAVLRQTGQYFGAHEAAWCAAPVSESKPEECDFRASLTRLRFFLSRQPAVFCINAAPNKAASSPDGMDTVRLTPAAAVPLADACAFILDTATRLHSACGARPRRIWRAVMSQGVAARRARDLVHEILRAPLWRGRTTSVLDVPPRPAERAKANICG